MELMRHELYKIFSRKSLYVVLALFYAFYGLIMFNQWKVSTGDYKEINRLTKQWAGPVGEEEVRWAEQGKQNSNDPGKSSSVNTLAPPMTSASRSVSGYDTNAVLSLFHSIVFVKQQQDAHQKQINELTIRVEAQQTAGDARYSVRAGQQNLAMLEKQKPYRLFYNIGWRDAIQFNTAFGAVVVGSLVLFGLAPVFTQEHTSRTAGFVFSSKKGRRELVTAKLAASAVYVTVVILSYSLINLVYHLLVYGSFGGWDPIFSIYYGGSPYSFPLWLYFGIAFLILLFGALVYGLLIVFVSALSRTPLVPLFAGIAVMAFPMLLENTFRVKIEWIRYLLAFSHTRLIQVQSLFSQYKAYSLFGYPVLYPVAIIALHTGIAACLLGLTYRKIRTQQLSG